MSAAQAVIIESDVRRIWAAVRFVDGPSQRTVEVPLQVSARGARWVRNLSGLHVLAELDETLLDAADRPPGLAAQLAGYEAAFELAPAVPALAVGGRVSDPSGRYLPRLFTVNLPRAQLPAGRLADRFIPVGVMLDPSPAVPLLGSWAALYVSVTHAGRPAAHAVLRLHRVAGGQLLGRAMSDARGQALLIAAGITQVTVGQGELVVEREIEADLTVSFDPAADPLLPIDPDALALRAGVVRRILRRSVASGRVETLALALP
ncbi:MAG: hypothetical protein IV092_22825 [Burkholderiaceae bacterium]|nr:hypothetical protein [Burkholderiaceae bacterium]